MSSTSAFSASRRAHAPSGAGALFLEEHPELTEQERLEVTDKLVYRALVEIETQEPIDFANVQELRFVCGQRRASEWHPA